MEVGEEVGEGGGLVVPPVQGEPWVGGRLVIALAQLERALGKGLLKNVGRNGVLQKHLRINDAPIAPSKQLHHVTNHVTGYS